MGTKYQGLATRTDLQKQINTLEKQLDPAQNPAGASTLIKGKDYLRRRIEQQKQRLAAITPPEIKPEEQPALTQRKRLLEEAISKGCEGTEIVPMSSVQQMKSNPDYSTEQHIQHESFWHNHTIDKAGNVVPAKNGYGALFELKDIRYREYRDNEALAHVAGSLEYLRSGAPQPLAFMHRAVSFSVAPSSQEKYDAACPDHIPTDVEVKAGIYTEEQRRERLAAVQAAKPRCRAVKTNGQACQNEALPGRDYCLVKKHRLQFEKPPVEAVSETVEATA